MKRISIRERLMASTVAGTAAVLVMAAVPAVALLAPSSAMAQSQTGAVRIAVTGNNGPIAGATVTVSSPDSLVAKTGVTEADGRVRVAGLDPATNYTIEVEAAGFAQFTANDVAVVSGRELSVGYALVATADDGDATELGDIVVTGRSLAAVDVTSATVGTTLTLDVVEALPTGRSYQSYLQLVPGVKPSDTGNPASRSGVNYRDVGGATGSSTDNVYYLDGVDVTDPYTGGFGSNFNSEIIQEQQVIVGGVPVEYSGGSGLVSRVITKSGSNEWHGSVNYYLQNDNLVAEDKHDTSNGFSTYDTAFTFGGPILKDRLWFFASYQKNYREDEVVDPNTGDLMRTVEREGEYGFLKATWQITQDDRLTASFFNDPTDISGSAVSTVLNNRDRTVVQGGDNYKIDYTRTWGDLLINAYFFSHEGELSRQAVDQSISNNVAFFDNPAATNVQRERGGYGLNSETFRNRDEYGMNAEYYLDSGFGSHTFKIGYNESENTYGSNSTIPGGVQYESVSTEDAGQTFASLIGGTGWTSSPFGEGDELRVITAINASANRAYFLGLLDTNGNGTISEAEMGAYQFTSTASNPHNQINAYRANRTIDSPYEVKSTGKAFYVQDTWTLDQLTVNAGLRAEEWTHYASDGSKLFTFDWEVAPRVSLVYDLLGDGRSKVFAFGGRYYDPIRNDMTNFAGGLTGPVTEEQIYLGNQWLTFRTRGGAVVPDSVFAPTLKTPYTDEFMIGASTTFGSDIGLSVTAVKRKTRDIMEDYDLATYSNPNAVVNPATGLFSVAHPGSALYLPYSYFGFDSRPNANYVIGTLAGGKRDYTGFEVTVQKFKTENWQGMASYTYNDAKGNTNSDGNADIQGDFIFSDPRAPNAWGRQPGNIKHQFKAFGSYEFDTGLEVSGVFNWNSGVLYTPASNTADRYLPPRVSTAYVFEGVNSRWYAPGYIGSGTGPSYFTFDMRFKYTHDLPIGGVEFFLDVFNVLDKQSATSEQKLVAGDGVYEYGEAESWVAPRRAYLGVRYSF